MSAISVNDAGLILFAINNNPLNNSPFFRQRLLNLKAKLQHEFEKRSNFLSNSIFSFEPTYIGLAEDHYQYLVKFLYAIYRKKKVFMLRKGSLIKGESMIPKKVRFKYDSAIFVLYSEIAKNEIQIDSNELQGISITSSQFLDSQATSNNKFLK